MSDKACTCGGSAASKGDEVRKGALDAAFDDLTSFWKARDGVDLVIPEGAHHGDLKEMLKAIDEADGTYDASRLITMQVEGHNHNRDLLKAIGLELREGQGVLVKALATLVSEFGSIKDALKAHDAILEEVANKPARSRSTTAQIQPREIVDPTGGADQDDSPRGPEFVKAVNEAESSNLLKAGDSTQAEFYSNRGFSLKQISEADPHLGARLTRALAGRKAA